MPVDMVTIVLLTVLKFFTAFLGVITGGGGLILIPSMIALGVPAVESVATSRVSNMGQSVTGIWIFNKSGQVDKKLGIKLAAVATVSVYVAANFVLTLNEAILTKMIGGVIIILLAITLMSKRLGLDEAGKTNITKQFFGYIMVFVVVFIATMVGASGIMMSYVLIFLFGQTFLKSSGTRKLVNIVGVFVATMVFALAGVVLWELAIPMLISGSLGGWVGSKYAIKKGNVWYKRVFAVIVAVLAVYMIFFA